VLTSQTVNKGVEEVVEALKAADYDGAKRKVAELSGEVKTERQRGNLVAASGIIASIQKQKEGGLHGWDQEKILRAARSIRKSQMADDFDAGMAEMLSSFARIPAKQA
jgi:predicted RNA-binding protein with EMAP domain